MLWVWADLSPSMNYASTLAFQSKLDRALVLSLALADSCVRAGRAERLARPHPAFRRAQHRRFAWPWRCAAESRRNDGNFDDLPPPLPLRPREKAVLIGDFLVDPAQFADTLQRLASAGARGHVLMVFDPAEEGFPFSGQTEFYDEAGSLLRAGRAEDYAASYHARLEAHRGALEQAARAQNWTFALHATDRPAAEALLQPAAGADRGWRAMSLFSLAFSSPFVLLALAGAPLLYLLLRVTPPPPRRIAFPPLKLILDLKKPDATPARTPLWLLILRMALAALVVLAMAGPIFSPSGAPAAKGGPLLLLVDDVWTAAPDWSLRMKAVESRLEEAGRQGRPAAIVAMTERRAAPAGGFRRRAGASARAEAATPSCLRAFRRSNALEAFLRAHPDAQVVWLSDGLAGADGRDFAEQLAALGARRRKSCPIRARSASWRRPTTGPAAMEVSLARAEHGRRQGQSFAPMTPRARRSATPPFDFGGGLTAKAQIRPADPVAQ